MNEAPMRVKCRLIITSHFFCNNCLVNIAIALDCVGGCDDEGYFKEWPIADEAKSAVTNAIEPSKAKEINSYITKACAASPWRAVMTDVVLGLGELQALGFSPLAQMVESTFTFGGAGRTNP
jgi:hypothetical protein